VSFSLNRLSLLARGENGGYVRLFIAAAVCVSGTLFLQWVRDLTREGIEPNPGPTTRSRRSKRPRQRRVTTATVQRALAPPGRTYKFTRWAQFGNIASSTSLFTNFSWKFALSDLPNSTEFTALYDQYRISHVTLMLISSTSQSIPSSVNSGCLYVVKDYDDASLLSLNTDYLQYQNCRVLNPVSRTIKVELKPRMAVATYAGGAFTSYANQPSTFIDAASPSVEHYGVKIGISATTAVITYQVVAHYTLEFKNPR